METKVLLTQPSIKDIELLTEVTYENLTRNSRFLDSAEEVEGLEIGEIVQIEHLGPTVYEGKIKNRSAFMIPLTRRGMNRYAILTFRGEGPFITDNHLLDFQIWADHDIYSPELDEELYHEKVELIRRAIGQ